MKLTKLLCMLLLNTMASAAQRQVVRDVTFLDVNGISTGAPIEVTVAHSEFTIKYGGMVNYSLLPDDKISKVTFRGYNPGKEQTRHIKVWLTNEMHEKNYILIYDNDYTIPHGGSAEERIPLLELELEAPHIVNDNWLYLKVECTGETMDTPLYFEYYLKGNDNSNKIPVVTLSLVSDVKTLSGKVINEKGIPVGSGAHVQLLGSRYGIFEADTDETGHYEVDLPGDQPYSVVVSAPGFITYRGENSYLGSDVKVKDVESPVRDFLLYDAIPYYKDVRATIILPVPPNPEWGRYYQLVKREGEEYVVFEREMRPMANVPYVIFPAKDFELKPGDYDLSQEAGSIEIPYPDGRSSKIKWAAFVGSFQSRDVFRVYTSEDQRFLDQTPDCETQDEPSGGRIGGCRAYLQLLTSSPKDFVYVFQDHDDAMGLANVTPPDDSLTKIYDLQGRRLNAQPSKGLYIQNGKKYVVK